MKLSQLAALGACVPLLAAAGCGADDNADKPAPNAADASPSSTSSVSPGQTPSVKGKKVTIVSCAASNPWCAAYNKTVKAKLEDGGARVTLYENAFDPAKQTSDMLQAVSQKPDLIVLQAAAGSAPVVPALKKAAAAGVPVMNVDGRVDPAAEGDVAIQVLSDNAKLGGFAAQNLVEGMKEAGYAKGNVMVITGTKSSLITADRMKTFDAYMADYPQYKVVAVEDGNWDPVKTGQIASQLLAKFKSQGGIQGAYGMADYMAIPIAEAAKQAGYKLGAVDGGLIVTGSNCTQAGIDALESGLIYGNATQDPVTIADDTVDWASRFMAAEKSPRVIYVKSDRLTRKNAEEFRTQCSGASS